MSICIEKIEYEGHTCQVFQDEETGEYTGYIFSEGLYVADPYKDKPVDYKPTKVLKSEATIQEEIEDIQSYPTLDYKARGLRKETLERFNIKTGLSRQDGETITTLHFPRYSSGKLDGYKTKLIEPKRFWSIGSMDESDLFGWDQAVLAGGKRLIVVEGELDVPASYQMLKDHSAKGKWSHLDPAIVSVPSGAGNAKAALVKHLTKIREHWEGITLAFDMDEAGQLATEEVVKAIPDVKVAKLPTKDASDCLVKGYSKAFCNAVLFNSIIPKNTRLVKGSTLAASAGKKPEWGISYPWEGITQLTRGKRRGEVVYWGAGVKMGKSELVNVLATHTILEHDSPILIIKPEEALARSYKMLVSKAAGKIFHDPKIEFDQEAWDIAEPLIGDKAIFIDNYQFIDWDVLKDDIRYAVVAEGVKDIMIDPIKALTLKLKSSEANEFLLEMTAELSSMAKDMDFSADIFCHLKSPSQGEPHEKGGKVLSSQFTGSRAMMQACHYMFGMEGNKDDGLPIEQRNRRDLVLLEDREFGEVGRVPLYWDWKTALFDEVVV